jgi:two-component SAPR family response regulator
VLYPLEEQYPVNNTKQKYGSSKTGVTCSILVLDDELDITSFIKTVLQRTKHTVFTFTDPVLALEHFKLNSKKYGLVISDIRMPGMNGFEFVKKVNEINSSVKIFLMSAFEIRDIEFSKVLPTPRLDGFIQKPISSKKLTEIIEKTI